MLLACNPCGRVMEFMRSPHRGLMRTFAGQPPARVYWYRVPEDRPVFYQPTVMRSRYYSGDEWEKENHGIGEQFFRYGCGPCVEGQEWYSYPSPPDSNSTPCGSEAAWLGNAVYPDDALDVLPNGVPACCCCLDVP